LPFLHTSPGGHVTPSQSFDFLHLPFLHSSPGAQHWVTTAPGEDSSVQATRPAGQQTETPSCDVLHTSPGEQHPSGQSASGRQQPPEPSQTSPGAQQVVRVIPPEVSVQAT
jgi:hypothetical protein